MSFKKGGLNPRDNDDDMTTTTSTMTQLPPSPPPHHQQQRRQQLPPGIHYTIYRYLNGFKYWDAEIWESVKDELSTDRVKEQLEATQDISLKARGRDREIPLLGEEEEE